MPDQSLPEYDAVSIVLVGSFNPRIFQPAWFVRQELLPAEAESASEVELINNDYCAFQTDWCRIEVLPDRFMAATLAAPSQEALRDLVLGAFSVLSHTPVQKVGFNSHGHFELRTAESWNEFGHQLAPKEELWAPILEKPGTLSVLVQGERTDGFAGQIRTKVEPSMRLAHGLYIETNNEFQQTDSDSSDWLAPVLTDQWEANRKLVGAIRAHLLASVR